MLAGEAVVAIWNGIAPEGRDEFYAWHLAEHIPERVGIPGFCRGRRLIASDGDTAPEFFTLYEAATMQVLRGPDYAGRLNAPTPWTRRATAHFRDTSRSIARVLDSRGDGVGGAMLTLRFDADPAAMPALAALLAQACRQPRITGVHLCRTDEDASAERSAESRDRSDLRLPPRCFALVEATDPAALRDVLPDAALLSARAVDVQRGRYRLEYLCTPDGSGSR
jgi:hypothetical protein